jgi:hypothetical protein
MITIGGKGWACQDCTILIANGDAPADLGPATLAEYLERVEKRTAGTIVVMGDEHDDFSWMPCDVCGGNLGGDRHRVHFLDS